MVSLSPYIEIVFVSVMIIGLLLLMHRALNPRRVETMENGIIEDPHVELGPEPSGGGWWVEIPEGAKYCRSLSTQDVLDLRRLGAEVYRAPRRWLVPRSLSHLSKEEVFKMLRDSYWEIHGPYRMKKGFEWVFET